jgi:hypothetical protein
MTETAEERDKLALENNIGRTAIIDGVEMIYTIHGWEKYDPGTGFMKGSTVSDFTQHLNSSMREGNILKALGVITSSFDLHPGAARVLAHCFNYNTNFPDTIMQQVMHSDLFKTENLESDLEGTFRSFFNATITSEYEGLELETGNKKYIICGYSSLSSGRFMVNFNPHIAHEYQVCRGLFFGY